MAAIDATLSWSQVSLVGNTSKTLGLLKAPTNQKLRIKEYCVTTDGAASSNAPFPVDIGRPTGAGTPGSTPTPKKNDPDVQAAIQATAGINYSAEPTWTSLIDRTFDIAQYGGFLHVIVPQTSPILVPG